MKRFVVVISMIAPLISSCSAEYKANMRARENIALYQTQAQTKAVNAVMGAIKVMIRPMEIQWQYENTGAPDCDTGGNPMLSAMKEMMRWHGMAELARARAQAVQYLAPALQAIYSQHMQQFGAPMSTNELLARVAGNIPMMTTVAGMYGLGVSAARYAGDQINATLEAGASFNHQGTQVGGHYIPGNDNALGDTTTSLYNVTGNPSSGGVNEVEFSEILPEEESE